MSQSHIQKFESSMFEYCSKVAERTYNLIEDGESEVGLSNLGHLADVLQILVESRQNTGITSINLFAQAVSELNEIDRDDVYAHLQENGFGQYIPE